MPLYTQGVGYYSKRFYEDSGVSEGNKLAVREFIRLIEAEGLSEMRVRKYYSFLHTLLRLEPGFVLGSRDTEALQNLVRKINASGYAEWSKSDLKVLLKKFYKTMNGGVLPSELNFFSTSVKRKDRKLPEDMLSDSEVEAMVRACKSPRDAALISLLNESGMRIGELSGLRLKHLKFDEYGVVVTIPEGKTGSRRIRLVDCELFLTNWLAVHPCPGRDSPLFVNIEHSRRGEMMRYESIRKVLKNVAVRARVPVEKVNPHNFRHTAATRLAQVLTEFQLCQYFGWVIGSDIPSIYVHLSGKNLDDKILEIHGLKKRDKLEPRKCFRCRSMNPPAANFCSVCKAPLSLEVALASEEEAKREQRDLIRKELAVALFERKKMDYLARKSKSRKTS